VRKVDIAKIDQLLPALEAQVADHVVHIHDGEREIAVMLSPERYRELLMKGVPDKVRPMIVELLDESIKKHGAVYEALAKLD